MIFNFLIKISNNFHAVFTCDKVLTEDSVGLRSASFRQDLRSALFGLGGSSIGLDLDSEKYKVQNEPMSLGFWRERWRTASSSQFPGTEIRTSAVADECGQSAPSQCLSYYQQIDVRLHEEAMPRRASKFLG